MIRVDSGVYYITNNATGCVYVGSTIKCFKYRWNTHRKSLNENEHINEHLQKSWNKHGETAFTFKIAEECEPDMCIQREQEHIDYLQSIGKSLYNICPVAGHPFRGRKHTEEWKKQASERTKAYYADPIEGENRRNTAKQIKKDCSEETRQKLSEATKSYFSNPENRKSRYNCTEETRKKQSERRFSYFSDPVHGEERRNKVGKGQKGIPKSEEAKEKIRKAHLGKPLSDEHKRKVSEGLQRFVASATMLDLSCQHCGAVYQSIRSYSKFCSIECKERARSKRRYKK